MRIDRRRHDGRDGRRGLLVLPRRPRAHAADPGRDQRPRPNAGRPASAWPGARASPVASPRRASRSPSRTSRATSGSPGSAASTSRASPGCCRCRSSGTTRSSACSTSRPGPSAGSTPTRSTSSRRSRALLAGIVEKGRLTAEVEARLAQLTALDAARAELLSRRDARAPDAAVDRAGLRRPAGRAAAAGEPDTGRRRLARARRNDQLARLDRLVDSILASVRGEGLTGLSRAPFDAVQAVDEIVETLRAAAPAAPDPLGPARAARSSRSATRRGSARCSSSCSRTSRSTRRPTEGVSIGVWRSATRSRSTSRTTARASRSRTGRASSSRSCGSRAAAGRAAPGSACSPRGG